MDFVIVFKVILVLLLLMVLFNLGRAMVIMIRRDRRMPMSRFLGRRVWFSAVIMLLLLLALALGLITPNPRPY